MTKDAIGSSLVVIGSSSAMVNAGPIPGRMPMNVPNVTPTRDQNRFIGVNAAANPSISEARASTGSAPQGGQRGEQPGGEPQSQAGGEQDEDRQRQNQPDADVPQ